MIYTILESTQNPHTKYQSHKILCHICNSTLICSERYLDSIASIKCPCKSATIKIGDIFGRLKVIEPVFNLKTGGKKFKCECECGNFAEILANSLLEGTTISCGCYNSEVHSTHKLTDSKEYSIYRTMVGRCTNPNHSGYSKYGSKGITICESWLDSFENFYNDMGPAPSSKHTIDRIDNNGNYEPTNCRWATQQEQNQNYSQNVVNEQTVKAILWDKYIHKLTVAQISRKYKLAYGTAYSIFTRKSWNNIDISKEVQDYLQIKK